VSHRSRASSNLDVGGSISRSAVAVGKNSSATVLARAELPAADVKRLSELMDDLIARLDDVADDEVRADADAVRIELRRKKVNPGLIRAALKGIVASLGAAQSMSDLVANIVSVASHLK
jgi:hypothetical protein